jgi:hypothetical protein
MEATIHSTIEGTRTRAIPGSTEISAIFFDFKTGEKTNAGTDARVEVRIGERRYPMPRRRGLHDLFERGGIDVIGFPAGRFCTPPEPRLTMQQLRNAPIVLAHDGSGARPAWLVERLSILVKLALPQEPVLEFKHWTDIGWLDAKGPQGTWAVLQPYDCGHAVPAAGCLCCQHVWPAHPGSGCKCSECSVAFPRLLHA